jgi:hypothetical protein
MGRIEWLGGVAETLRTQAETLRDPELAAELATYPAGRAGYVAALGDALDAVARLLDHERATLANGEPCAECQWGDMCHWAGRVSECR